MIWRATVKAVFKD